MSVARLAREVWVCGALGTLLIAFMAVIAQIIAVRTNNDWLCIAGAFAWLLAYAAGWLAFVRQEGDQE